MRDFQKPERSEVFSSNGMIATSHPLAAKIGIDAMSKGGMRSMERLLLH